MQKTEFHGEIVNSQLNSKKQKYSEPKTIFNSDKNIFTAEKARIQKFAKCWACAIAPSSPEIETHETMHQLILTLYSL